MLDWAFIQAGGRSSRMGTDKSWVEIEGHPMIERVFAAARPTAERLGIVINRANPNIERYERLADAYGAQLITDLHDHRGPLGGFHTALCHLSQQQNLSQSSALILACDLPFVTSEFLWLLAGIHERESNALTLPADNIGRLQPLAAIYSMQCLPVVERLLKQNALRVDELHDRVQTRRVGYQEYQHLRDAERLLLNLNRPEDFSQ